MITPLLAAIVLGLIFRIVCGPEPTPVEETPASRWQRFEDPPPAPAETPRRKTDVGGVR